MSKLAEWNNTRKEFHFGLYQLQEFDQKLSWNYFSLPDIKSYVNTL